MKILIHSNGPNVSTGYGIQVAQLGRRLKAAGHEVAFSAYYGQPVGFGDFEGMKVYPAGHDAYGNDILAAHAMNFFEGDPSTGWIFVVMDVFGLETPILKNFNVLAWTPVDHHPVPDAVLDFFRRNPNAVPVAMSKWGQDMLKASGLDALYAPLTFESETFKPTEGIESDGRVVPGRTVMGVPDESFVVMMNGMNKGWAIPRKSFPRAFAAFGDFARRHPDAVLFVNSHNLRGMGGDDLTKLAQLAAIPEGQIRFVDQYAHQIGVPAEAVAAFYSSADVLLAPSMGEGFCVPLIEAQACGTPVIVTNFSAQPELVGAGWLVESEPWLDSSQDSWMVAPHMAGHKCSDCGHVDGYGIVDKLEAAYEAWESGELAQMAPAAEEFASRYTSDAVFQKHWLPILNELDPEPLPLDREPIPKNNGVAVLVPVLSRPENVAPLVESFNETNDGSAELYFVIDPDDEPELLAIQAAHAKFLISDRGETFAQKVNAGFEQTLQPWVFLCGDDVRFRDGWIEAARKLSDRYDVIGTNDHPEGKGNPRVAAGAHADHFFVRREYINKWGGNLGPGVLSEKYGHFFCDVETVELAKARRVFSPCLDSLVEHMHPDLGKAEVDEVYVKGWSQKEHDAAEWAKRAPLVAMQKVGRG